MPPEIPAQEEAAKPRVSIVIVTRNCEAALRRALAALEASKDRERFEVLTVDAGSSDGCPRIDTEFPSTTVLRLPRNFGKTRARNIGMRTAQADLILFLDPHVEVEQGTVDALAAVLETRDDAAAAAPMLVDEAGQPVGSTYGLPAADELAEASLKGPRLAVRAPAGDTADVVDEAAILVRRNFVAGMNYLDEKRFSEYWSLLEVCWQIRNAGKKIVVAQGARAVLIPGRDRECGETAHIADRVAGAAAYIGKHNGLMAGISFRIKCFLSVLGGLKAPLAWSILMGSRIDPTQ